jgi:hypothetical protein
MIRAIRFFIALGLFGLVVVSNFMQPLTEESPLANVKRALEREYEGAQMPFGLELATRKSEEVWLAERNARLRAFDILQFGAMGSAAVVFFLLVIEERIRRYRLAKEMRKEMG